MERPLQLNYQVTEERLENLYAYNGFSKLAESKSKNPEEKITQEEEGKKKQDEIIAALKTVDDKLYKEWKNFEGKIEKALRDIKIRKTSRKTFIKNVILSLSEHDESAEYVLDAKGKKIPDKILRDYEKIPLRQDIEEYFVKEVKAYYSDAWMNRKKDKIGYEIIFTQYFYEYIPPRPLEEIEEDIKKVTAEIQELIKEDIDET